MNCMSPVYSTEIQTKMPMGIIREQENSGVSCAGRRIYQQGNKRALDRTKSDVICWGPLSDCDIPFLLSEEHKITAQAIVAIPCESLSAVREQTASHWFLSPQICCNGNCISQRAFYISIILWVVIHSMGYAEVIHTTSPHLSTRIAVVFGKHR